VKKMSTAQYSKWSVAIISTDLDLHYLRDAVESTLKELGFEVIAFEQPDYPVYPNVHSHEACLIALQNCDIVVLIIDKRFGGLYLGNGPESITMKEYRKAYELGKIIIPCISNKAAEEWRTLSHIVKQLVENGNISLGDVREKISPKYVDNWDVLDFIGEIHEADKNNFVVYFDSTGELQNRLKGRLKGLTRFICHKIVKAQMQYVESIKTTTFALSIGDVLKRGYFIEPPYELLSGTSLEETVSQICDLSDKDVKIMIVGEPGIGKSTLLLKSFLTYAEKCLKEKSNRIPFYLSLRGLGPTYHFNFKQFIRELCQQYLGKDIYPLFEASHIEPVFYIDGFDELAEQAQDIELRKVLRSKFFSSPFIVCSRTRFAEERLGSLGFSSQIQVLIRLLPWEKELSWEYVRKFCDLRGKPQLYGEIFNAYYGTEETKRIFENPLLLTMFLWIIEESGMKLPLDVRDQVSVYEKFIDLWIKRELALIGMNDSSISRKYAELIKKAWQLTAWEIYKRRFTGDSINRDILAEQLKFFNPEFEAILNIRGFWDFLDIRFYTGEIKGMFHEQFMEHLLAKEIISSCKEGNYPFPEFLKYEIRYEINKIVRALWKYEERDGIKKILQNLWSVYKQYLSNKDPSSIAIRNHAMYYIGRLPDPEAKDMLKVADMMESEIFVKLSIAFGLIKLEDYEKEEELFEKMEHDEVWDRANRGYHLVYYGDWILKDETPPYLDDGTKPWARTFKALLRHIQSQEKRHIALRRIELLTIRRFIEVRGYYNPPMVRNDLKIIENAINRMEDEPQGFLKKVKDEFDKLKNTFDKINSNIA